MAAQENEVRLEYIFSYILINIFLWKNDKVTTGGRNITTLQFADEINALAEKEQE